MPDHMHVAISMPPKLCVATLIGQLKGASSHHINQTYTGGSSLWQAEYGVSSFSEKALSIVVDYVNHQKKHHANKSLNDEPENMPSDGIKT